MRSLNKRLHDEFTLGTWSSCLHPFGLFVYHNKALKEPTFSLIPKRETEGEIYIRQRNDLQGREELLRRERGVKSFLPNQQLSLQGRAKSKEHCTMAT